MRFRPLVILSLCIWLGWPVASALADDTTSPAEPAPAASASPSSDSSSLQNNGGASVGGSSADSGTLQPAGNAPLQAGNDASNGLTAPASQALQAPASPSDDLKVLLQNEADGPQQPPAGGNSHEELILGAVGLALLLALGAALWGRFRGTSVASRK